MDFHFTQPQTDFERFFGGFYYINAIGPVERNDHRKFLDFLHKVDPPRRLTVYLDSVGGDVEAAISIGRLIRERWFSTSVGSYILDPELSDFGVLPRIHNAGICASAATLIFIGGRLRYLPGGSKFGVHQFSFRNPLPSDVSNSQILSAKIATYVHEMGISPMFLEISSSTPSSQIDYVGEEKLRALKVVTDGVTEVEWSLKAANQIMYVRGERDTLFGHQKVMLCYAKGLGFAFWSVIESQGREAELTGFGIVEIVLNGEDVRIDISQRCERQVVGLYTNVFAKISQEEAREIAFSDSFGIQIRFSNEAPLFFGISAMSTDGGKEQLQTFFNTFSTE